MAQRCEPTRDAILLSLSPDSRDRSGSNDAIRRNLTFDLVVPPASRRPLS